MSEPLVLKLRVPTGNLHFDPPIVPGDIYSFRPHEDRPCWDWDNCSGIHWYVRLRNGDPWHASGRASNCTKPLDKTHRCWVLSNEGEKMHVSKDGNTCNAGAGSIRSDDDHCFLRNGALVDA